MVVVLQPIKLLEFSESEIIEYLLTYFFHRLDNLGDLQLNNKIYEMECPVAGNIRFRGGALGTF